MPADAVDLHAHLVTRPYREALAAHGALDLDGFPLPGWSADEHLALMDAAGIGTALVSLSSPNPWFGDAAEAAALARSLNDEASAAFAASGGRLPFAATLPVPDADASLAELGRAAALPGFAAVRLATNAGGVYPGDPRLEPLMDALDELGAVVLLHPCATPGDAPDCLSGRLRPLMEFPADTTRAVIDLVASGTLARHPRVRVVVPHCGSFVARTAPRLAGMARALGREYDLSQLGLLWWDLAGDVTREALDELLTITGPDRLLYGSDWPFTPAPAVMAKQRALRDLLGPDGWDQVARHNPQVLLGSLPRP